MLSLSLGLAGACLLGSFSITVVMAQRICRQRTALASELTLGLATGLGGLEIGVLGSLARAVGIRNIVLGLMVLPRLDALLGLGLRSDRSGR